MSNMCLLNPHQASIPWGQSSSTELGKTWRLTKFMQRLHTVLSKPNSPSGLHYVASKTFPRSNLCLNETEAGVCSPSSVKHVGWIRMVSRFLPALTIHGFRISINVQASDSWQLEYGPSPTGEKSDFRAVSQCCFLLLLRSQAILAHLSPSPSIKT